MDKLIKYLRGIVKKIYYKNIAIIDYIYSFYQNSNDITYYPTFKKHNLKDLEIHYAKANWFFKSIDIQQYNVYIHTKNISDIKIPDFMINNKKNLTIKKNLIFLSLIKSKNILLWNNKSSLVNDLLSILIYFLSGKRIYFINNNDIRAKEYNIYALLPWIIFPNKRKKELIHKMKQKLKKQVKYLKSKYNFSKSYVIANGPSLENIFKINVNDGYAIVANSIVRNKKMISYINPKFIVAGDPLWHFGACKYSEQFRNDLVSVLKESSETYAVFPVEAGFVNYLNVKELRDKTILIPYNGKIPNYNLEENFSLPAFTSVINSLMLPLASTLSNEIYILGSDGKVKHIPNEDFWAHAGNVQYPEELVETGHKCSPTFDKYRKSYDEIKAIETYLTETIIIGEKYHNKKYFNLSNITTFGVLKKRDVEQLY